MPWIKMRIDLYEDPAVIQMADEMGQREEVVVGFLHRIWSWASRQCHGGTVTGVDFVSLGRVTACPGFPAIMERAGWLESGMTSDGKPFVRFPKWDRHLSEGAKERALSSERKQRQRKKNNPESVTEMSRSKRDNSVTREEKRREENKKKESKPKKEGRTAFEIPPPVELVRQYCRERRNSIDPEHFVDFYTSKGWMVGKAKMKDWRAAVRNWEKDPRNGARTKGR